MPYIGNQPAEQFTSFATQEFSTSATTSYTLDHAVTNENEIALFINNVRQQPGSGKAYTASSTTLTLSAATASTDTMYCVFLGRALQTVTPATNSITAAMVGNDLISGKDALTSSPADTDELLISDAGTLKRIDVSLVGGKNTPAFEAYLSAGQSMSDNTLTKVQFNTEVFDTDNTYDNSTNYRFTPGVAGKYFVYAMAQLYATYDANDISQIKIYKNGSANVGTTEDSRHDGTRVVAAVIHSVIDLDDNDYLEIYVKVDASSGSPEISSAADSSDGGNYGTRFGAFKLVGA